MAKKTRTPHRLRQIEEATHRRVAIYLRRSTDEDNQPYSLEAQETKLRAFVESQPGDWHIVKVYSDDASGATSEREDLQKMLRAARAGMFDTLLVYRVDRFSRRLRDLVALLDELDEAGVVFRSATEPFDTSTPIGRMLVQMLGVFAGFEREVIIDRVIAGMERKAAKGLWNGGITPYGYAVHSKAHNYTIVEAEAATVRLIFDLYTKDRLGTRAIANVLNDRGLRTRRGKPWSQRSVETVITNRQYIGEKHFRDISAIDAHDPIIKRGQFNQAQHILTKRSEDIGQRAANASEYTLTGKIPCPQCGSKFIGTVAHGSYNRNRYYMCWSRNRYGSKEGCDIHRFNADELETAIGQALLDFYTTGHDVITEAVNEFLADFSRATSTHHNELAAINRELKENTAAVDRYLTAFEKGTLDDEDTDVQARLTKLKAQSKQLRSRGAEIEFDLEQPPDPTQLGGHSPRSGTRSRRSSLTVTTRPRRPYSKHSSKRSRSRPTTPWYRTSGFPPSDWIKGWPSKTQPLINHLLTIRFAYRHIRWAKLGSNRACAISIGRGSRVSDGGSDESDPMGRLITGLGSVAGMAPVVDHPLPAGAASAATNLPGRSVLDRDDPFGTLIASLVRLLQPGEPS